MEVRHTDFEKYKNGPSRNKIAIKKKKKKGHDSSHVTLV